MLVPTNVCIGDGAGAGSILSLVRGGERLMNDAYVSPRFGDDVAKFDSFFVGGVMVGDLALSA